MKAFLRRQCIGVAVVTVYVVATVLLIVVIPAAMVAVGCHKACDWAVARWEVK